MIKNDESLIDRITSIPDGNSIPQDISTELQNTAAKDLSWELFSVTHAKESLLGNFGNSAIIARKLMEPLIFSASNNVLKGAVMTIQEKEDLLSNAFIELLDACKSYNEMKGKFPVYSKTFIVGAIRNTFETNISHYDRKKIIEDIVTEEMKKDPTLSLEDAIEKAKLRTVRPASIDETNEDGKSLGETLESDCTIEEEYDKLARERKSEIMIKFFKLNAKNGQVSILQSFGLWNEVVSLFKDNDRLFDEFAKKVNGAYNRLYSDELEEMEI